MPSKLELMQSELEIVNQSIHFWRLLDENLSIATCNHDHGSDNPHFHMSGNFLIAQTSILDSINIVFSDAFDPTNSDHQDHLLTLAAIHKAQDQLSGGNYFVSQRTLEFDKYFKISNSLTGKKVSGHTAIMPNAKNYLIKKFNLNSTQAKANVILESQETALKKAGQLVDLGFKDAVDPLVAMAGSVYKAAPSLALSGLALGTAQMVLRSCGDQDNADKLRDNIGASTEAAAFFVLVNGVLENLSHSFILAAPAFTTVAAYDASSQKLKSIYDYFSNVTPESSISDEVIDLEIEDDTSEETEIIGSFTQKYVSKSLFLLKQIKSLIHEDAMWVGLRKHQIAYQDNHLEERLKNNLDTLLTRLKDNPSQINALLQEEFAETIRDSFEMLNAYCEVYDQKNPASGVRQFSTQFCDHFARDGLLLIQPSKDAKMAAFFCRSNWGLVSFEEKIKESLPHMPTGQQVLLAATFIGALYSASAIYKSVTGEEESYSDYVINFPDHLFEWLQLDQMYQNMGGDAEFTQAFKDFFAKFNLAENSTHLGIAAAPFIAYAQMGSKMFENITHTPANYMAYAADLTKSYVEATSTVVGNWFGGKRSAPIAPYSNIEAEEEDHSNDIELGNIGVNDPLAITPQEEVSPMTNSLQIPPKKEEEKIEKKNVKKEALPMAFCGSADQVLSQLQQFQPASAPKNPQTSKFRKAHIHGPNCNHK